jgi:hypothetical protein
MKTLISVLIIGTICFNTHALFAQNAPISTIGMVETYDDSAIVSITVTDFTNIGACDLLITYDSTMATATSVTVGSGVGYMFFIPNILTPGQISVSWLFFQPGIPGLSLPDSSVFLNITFERTGYGISAIEFDTSNQFYCFWADDDYDELNDIPYSTYYLNGSIFFEMIDAPVTSAPAIESCGGSETTYIPVTVSDFNQVGAFNLTMQYDSLTFFYQSFTNNSGFPALDVVENIPGTLIIDGISDAPGGVNLANNTILFTLHFGALGGSTALTWLDLGESCEYFGPAPLYVPRNDVPQSAFYMNGYFTELQVPEPAGTITGPVGGTVCRGDSNTVFSIAPIAFANDYEWELPVGAIIQSGAGTPEISVSFDDSALGGNILVYGINECGDGIASPSYQLIVDVAPSITQQPASPDSVNPGSGIAHFSITAVGSNLSYQWQEFTDDWTNLAEDEIYSGVFSTLLTITNPPISMNGNKYRCIVGGSCEPPAISDGNATLSVVLSTGFDEWNTAVSFRNESLKFNSFPNPFSDQITFAYAAPSQGIVNITIIDMYGVIVADITDQIETQGYHKLFFNSNQLTKGVYIASITFKNDTMIISDQLITISMKY